ncbi:hypothetical protein FO519_002582 [Halicephalobus sp. NKZ332]|nr:hypothetical protein FO519_002582 [Halicephalobus sp. NKZ332]
MARYGGMDLSLKKNMDFLQFQFHCCGADSPLDWQKTDEMDLSEESSKFIETIKKMEFKILFLSIIFVSGVGGIAPGALPTLIPLRYDLQLQLPTAAPEDDLIPAFFGSIKIDFQLSRPVFAKYPSSPIARFDLSRKPQDAQKPGGAELRLQALRLSDFENVTLEGNGRSFEISNISIQKEELVITVTEAALAQGRYSLNIDKYTGIITYEKGIFYRDAGHHPILGTNLFPNYARSVFPCFDDPAAKATVQLNVIHPKYTTALSSMQSTEPTMELSESWQLTRFAEVSSLSLSMLSLAILPSEYIRGYAGSKFPIYIWTNKKIVSRNIAADLSNMTGRVYDQVREFFTEELPFKQINVVLLNEFNGTQSFGTVFIGMEEWNKADDTHKTFVLATAFIQQWIGGLTTISSRAEICFQEDLVHYLANKIVKRLYKSEQSKWESYRLAEYVRIQMSETFFAPGESLVLSEDATEIQITSHCGLKGVVQLESLETVLGEPLMLAKIRSLVTQHKFRTYKLESLLEHLRMHLVDSSINLAQVYEFWHMNGGIPSVHVEKVEEKVRFTQLNRNRQSQIGNHFWAPMPLWPLRLSIRNLTLPVTFMVSQGLEMAPIDKKVLTLTNFDYQNLYRVNYDSQTWNRIRESMTESPKLFTPRARAQIVNDFCYFYSLGEIGDNADKIRRDFLELIRTESESFDLCEFYAFWCIAGNKRKISLRKENKERMMQLMPRVFTSLTNRDDFACFDPPPSSGNNASSTTANALCQTVFGIDYDRYAIIGIEKCSVNVEVEVDDNNCPFHMSVGSNSNGDCPPHFSLLYLPQEPDSAIPPKILKVFQGDQDTVCNLQDINFPGKAVNKSRLGFGQFVYFKRNNVYPSSIPFNLIFGIVHNHRSGLLYILSYTGEMRRDAYVDIFYTYVEKEYPLKLKYEYLMRMPIDDVFIGTKWSTDPYSGLFYCHKKEFVNSSMVSRLYSIPFDLLLTNLKQGVLGKLERDFGLEEEKQREFVQVTNGLVYSRGVNHLFVGSLRHRVHGSRCRINSPRGSDYMFVVSGWEYCKLRDGENANITTCLQQEEHYQPLSECSNSLLWAIAIAVIANAVILLVILCVVCKYYKHDDRDNGLYMNSHPTKVRTALITPDELFEKRRLNSSVIDI